VLVSSVDGVGTKLKIASALNKHDTVGIDIVNHCINDIFLLRCRTLFSSTISPWQARAAKGGGHRPGLAQACKEAGCALIGGRDRRDAGTLRRRRL